MLDRLFVHLGRKTRGETRCAHEQAVDDRRPLEAGLDLFIRLALLGGARLRHVDQVLDVVGEIPFVRRTLAHLELGMGHGSRQQR